MSFLSFMGGVVQEGDCATAEGAEDAAGETGDLGKAGAPFPAQTQNATDTSTFISHLFVFSL